MAVDENEQDDLPEGWKFTTIEQVADVQGGKRLPRGAEYSGQPTPYPYIRVTDFKNRTIESSDLKYLPKNVHEKIQRYVIHDTDIYISIAGTIGVVGIIPAFLSGANLTENAAKIVPFSCVQKEYLMYFLDSHEAQEQLSEKTMATTQPKLALFRIKSVQFPLSPLAEQKRIVAKVEDLLARVNAAKERLTGVPAILKRFRQSVLAAACSGRLTEDWREKNPDAEPASDLLERIRAEYRLKLLSVDQEEAGDFENLPDSWTTANFIFLTRNFDGKRIPIKADDRALRRGQYPYYGASGIIDSIDDFIFNGDFLLIGEDGANLLARSTPIAYQASGKFWLNNHAHIVQTKCGIPLSYLEIFINSIDLQQYVTGSAQPKLTQAALNGIPITLPPLVEQHEIVRRVESLFALSDEIERRVAAGTRRAEKITQSVLAKAFRGELVPTEAELARLEGRDYEPASVLLERIKASAGNKANVKRKRNVGET